MYIWEHEFDGLQPSMGVFGSRESAGIAFSAWLRNFDDSSPRAKKFMHKRKDSFELREFVVQP